MVDAHWEDVRGEELRYRGYTWELTGDVEVRGTGERVRVGARQVDDVKHEHATLLFAIADGDDSINPGAIGDVYAGLEREDGRVYLVVEREPRTYRYELLSLEYE